MTKTSAKPSDRSKTRSDERSYGFIGSVVLKTITAVITIMIFLSVVSYRPEDTHILSGGAAAHAAVSNWVGLFGAYVSAQLIAWLGLAAYGGILLMLVSVANRIVSKDLRPANKVYVIGFAVSIWGLSMLLGAFPGAFAPICGYLNIAETPGGVVGQRFCAPWTVGNHAGGWLAYVVNQPGSVLISLAMFIVGLLTLWYFDWRGREFGIWAMLKGRVTEIKTTGKKDKFSSSLDEKIKEKESKAAKALTRAKEAAKKLAVAVPEVVPAPAPEPKPAPKRASPKVVASRSGEAERPYKLPSVDLLNPDTTIGSSCSPAEIESKKEILQETLDSFSIDAIVGETTSGPRVTLFEIKPAPGVKVERISSLSNNIAMNLKAENLRILTPIPGKDTVGIEVPNRVSANVPVRSLIESRGWSKTKAAIPLVLGKDISGKPAILDLAVAPHLLIAGATGSGKSVCMNTIILSLLYRFSPAELQLIMVDPKVVEFSGYNTLPHLVTPVVTQVKKVPVVLRWVLNQMEWRYETLSKVGVRNLASYNSRKIEAEPVCDDDGNPIPDRLPFLVVIIDELADIMMTAKADVETSLARIAQLARAVGIHAIIATQRPSVNVITGVIKANFPTRIAFQVTSVVDSRTILDGKGAESLLGRGDMLFKSPGGSKVERIQGAMVEDDEILKVVSCVSEQAEPQFLDEIISFNSAASGDSKAAASESSGAAKGSHAADGEEMNGDDELVQRAIEIILRDRRATTSHIQRRLRIGYNRAALVIEELERRGVIGPQVGTAPRQILVDEAESAENTEDTAT